MAWQPNKPQPGDDPRQSQDDLLQNFININTWTDVNHMSIGSAASINGMHKFLTLVPQGANPAGALTTANYLNMWVDNANEPQLRRGVDPTIPFMNRQNGTDGWTYLPSGLVIKWQRVSDANTGVVTRNFNSFGPAFVNPNGIFTIQTQIINPTAATDPDKFVHVHDKANPNAVTLLYTQRTTTGNSVGTTVYFWIAIGRVN